MTVGARQRLRVRVEGTVQGVGFRPFVYRVATELGLGGWVLNDSRGVLIEAEGERRALEELLERLRTDAPPLAVVERVSEETMAATGEVGFRITESEEGGEPEAAVSPDVATCEECLAELLDPGDRRHRYPFTNCTNCGPRFTIVRGVPYDRPLTTMASFEMCELCRAEYEDPLDRRFHAQPNACPVCGPSLRLADRAGRSLAEGNEPSLEAATLALAEGRIVAVKGLGGYHLACRADDEAVVAELRARKHREDKPFALMAPSVDSALALVELDDAAGALLDIPGAPDRAGAAPPRCPGRPLRRTGLPRARRDAALLAAPPSPARGLGRGPGDDQRERLGRADRLPGRGRSGPARRNRGCVPGPRPADRDADGRLGRAGRRGPSIVPAPLPRLRSARSTPLRRQADPRLRRRAQEHLLPRQGRAGLDRPPHRRPEELRDPPLLHGGDRALRGAVCGGAGAGRSRSPPGVPLHQVRPRA